MCIVVGHFCQLKETQCSNYEIHVLLYMCFDLTILKKIKTQSAVFREIENREIECLRKATCLMIKLRF